MTSADPFHNDGRIWRAWVWSAGLEEWEAIALTREEMHALRFLYYKHMNGVMVNIYRDALGRFVRTNSL